MTKKLLALLLSSVIVLGLVAGCGNSNKDAEKGEEENKAQAAIDSIPEMMSLKEDPMEAIPQAEILAKVPKTEPKGQIVFGSATEPDEYIMDGFTNPSPNLMARQMMSGYSTFVYDKNNEIVRNNVVLKDFKRTENPDGSVTFEEEIYDNLKWSDGKPITAEDYVCGMLFSSNKVLEEIGANATTGDNLVGFKEFHDGDGTTPFKGVRLLDKYKFSFTLDKEQLPNYYEFSLGATAAPFPAHATGLDLKIVDSGNGAAFAKPLNNEELNKKLMAANTGFAFTYPVTDGPYKFVEFDKANKALILEANPEFLGTFDGWKPQIKKVIIKFSQDKIMVDELANGSIDVMSEASGKTLIEQGLSKMKESNGKIDVLKFDRNGFGLIDFACDVGAAQFKEVRQAITYAINRTELVKKYTGGYGKLVYSAYGLAQPEYKANKKLFDEKLNPYNFDLNKAKEVLEAGGWTLNAKGGKFVEGTDDVRYKKLDDGSLMACQINWANTSSPVAELLNAELPSNLAKIGIKLNSEQVNFPKMQKHLLAPIGSEDRKKYNMYVLATGFAIISPYWYYYSPDPSYRSYNQVQIKDADLYALTLKMKATKPGDKKTWYKLFGELQLKLNDLMPSIPLYSDQYHLFYNTKVKNLNMSSLVSFGRAVVYAVKD